MNQIKKINSFNLINIYLILLISIIFTLITKSLIPNQLSLSTLKNNFFLSSNNIIEFKLWTIITYSISHTSFLELFISLIPLYFLTQKLKHLYSIFELGKFYIYSSIVGAISHIILSPSASIINGSIGIVFGFMILYTRFYGQKPILKIYKNFILNFNIITCFLIIINLLSIQFKFRIDNSSFACHLGILIFCYFYIQKDKNRFENQNIKYKPIKKNLSKVDSNIIYGKQFHSQNKSFPNKNSNNYVSPSSKQIDEILDKISSKGMESLSKKEKEILHKASKMSK